jgi:hypothetical protein
MYFNFIVPKRFHYYIFLSLVNGSSLFEMNATTGNISTVKPLVSLAG